MKILKHDAQGFLVGDPIDIGRALAVWQDIQSDVHAIRHGMLGIDKSPAVKAFQEVAQPMAREAFSKSQQKITVAALLRPQSTPFGRGNAIPSAKVAQNSAAHVNPISKKAAEAVAKPAGRDGRGRFVKSGAQPGGDNGKDAGSKDTPDERALSGIADRIVSAVSGAGSGLEEADPAVKAFQEVAQPMARGFGVLTGGSGDKRKENWFRRIYASLTGFRKDESVFNKAANKSLKNIEEKPEGGDGGSGMLGGLFPLLAKIPLIGPLLAGAVGAVGALLSKIPVIGSLFKKIPVVGGVGAAAGGAAGAAKGVAGKGILGAGKGLLRKLPLIGALIAGAGAASDIYGSETDDTLSRRDKDKNAGKATGGLAGTLAGGFAGASAGAAIGALGGPIGIAIGGFVGGALGMFLGDQAGQIIGDTVGGWVSDLRGADIPGKIVAAWDSTMLAIKSGWDGMVKRAGALWEGAKKSAVEAGNSANDAIKEKTGIDVKAETKKAAAIVQEKALAAKQAAEVAAKKTAEAASAAATKVKEKTVEVVKQGAGKAGDAIKQGATWAAENTTVGKGAAKVWEGAKSAGNWALGKTSQMFESGKGGAGTVSSGKGDFGGASYGTYQLSSKQGKVQDFLKSSKYGDQFAGLAPGSPEFNAKWKDVSKADPEFGNAQHDFIKKTNFDPAMEGLKKGGMDLSGRGAAVQDALWSTSVQFGAGSQKKGNGAIGMFQKALAGKDISKMSDADITSAVQDYKIANNDKLFASSDDKTRKGTAIRAEEEKKRLAALASQDGSATSVASIATPSVKNLAVAPAKYQQVQTAFVAAPTMPSFSSPPAITEAPPIINPLASSSEGRKAISVTMPTPDAGQDLKDRRIAHIVTGGFSA